MTEQTYVSDGPVDSEQAQELREGMVAALQAQGVLRGPEVVVAIQAVPRHVFGPDDGLESAYALRTVLHRTLDRIDMTTSVNWRLLTAHIGLQASDSRMATGGPAHLVPKLPPDR